MKKLVVVCSIAFLLLFLLPSSAKAQYDTGRFSLKLYGGLNYLGGGDLNKGAAGFGDTWFALFDGMGLSPSGEFGPANLGMDFGGEFIYQFTPSIGIGLGVGYLSATKSSTISYSPTAAGVELFWKSALSAIPITASFYYFMPSGGNLKFFFNVGLGYYLAKADFEHKFWLIIPANWDAKTTGGGLGFHGGLGLEYSFSPMVGLIFEVKGRYASFSNFEGDVVWSYPWGGPSNTTHGKLWAVDENIGGSVGTVTWIWLDSVSPAGTNPRNATVDFSGFAVNLGLVIHF
jgi:hypothetical protein